MTILVQITGGSAAEGYTFRLVRMGTDGTWQELTAANEANGGVVPPGVVVGLDIDGVEARFSYGPPDRRAEPLA